MEDDSNSRFGLADDAGFDIWPPAIAFHSSSLSSPSPSLFQRAMAPNTTSRYLTVAESDNNSVTGNDDSFKTAWTSELDDTELALDVDSTMNYDLIYQRKRSMNEDEQLSPRAKRQEICEASVSLLPEIWAMTMNHLDYKSILSCAATSRPMLRDVMPLVTTINIENAEEMHAITSTRLRDVREVNIYSLLRIVEHEEGDDHEDPDTIELMVDRDTAMRSVPFMSRFLKLERVFFGGKNSNGDVVGFADGFIDEDEDDNEAGNTLIDLISSAFQSHFIPAELIIHGLRCIHSNTENNLGEISGCSVCQRACRSFPLDQVINFENEGSSLAHRFAPDMFYSNRPYTLDVCLTRSEIESIVEARPGGNELLHSNARLLYLLSRGSRYVVPSEDGSRAFYIVKYSKRELSELERVIAYSQLDVKKCSRADLTRAIMRSFAGSDRQSLPSNDQCYLVRASFDYLKEKIGLDICVEDFSFERSLANLPLICKVVTSNASIKADCFDLLYVFVTDRGIQEIQYLIDKKLMPTLVHTLISAMNSAKPLFKKSKIACMLGAFTTAGRTATKTLIDHRTIPALVKQSLSANCRASLHALGRIACVSVQYRDKVLEAGAKRALETQLMRRCNDWDSLLMSASTLSMLCTGAPPPDFVCTGFWLAELQTFLDPTLDWKIWFRARQISNGRPSAPVDIPPCCDKMLSICCSTLVHLCGGPIDLIEVMNEKGIFDRLLSLLNHNSDVVNRLVLTAIRRLVIRDKPFILPIINGGILCRLMFFLSKDGDGERYDVNIRQDACQILSIVVMCDNKGLKILALSFDDSALVLLCALVTIDTASTLYGLKALKKVSNCTICQNILYAIFTKITLPFILFRFLKCVIHLASSQPALRYNV